MAKTLFSQQNQIVQRPRVFRTNLSAYALHIGDRGGVLMTLIPSVRSTPSSGRKEPSRSWIRHYSRSVSSAITRPKLRLLLLRLGLPLGSCGDGLAKFFEKFRHNYERIVVPAAWRRQCLN